MQKSDGSSTILVVEVYLYGSKEKESDNHLHEKMNAWNARESSSESGDGDDLKLIVEPEHFSLTEALEIGNLFQMSHKCYNFLLKTRILLFVTQKYKLLSKFSFLDGKYKNANLQTNLR